MNVPQIRWLGRLGYKEALALQEEAATDRATANTPDQILLLEHDPVYTIGRRRDRSSLGNAHLPHPVEETNRGGQATFHGPGQLVGYFVFDLRESAPDLHVFLRWIEEGLIALLAAYGLTAQRREGLTGVWIHDRKIASIGVGVRRWITMHGFGLNIGSDLSGFAAITPCGIQGVTMTSVSRELEREISVEEAAEEARRIFLSHHASLAGTAILRA